MRWSKIWHLALALFLIFWGLQLLGWVTLDSDILGIGAIVTAVLILINK